MLSKNSNPIDAVFAYAYIVYRGSSHTPTVFIFKRNNTAAYGHHVAEIGNNVSACTALENKIIVILGIVAITVTLAVGQQSDLFDLRVCVTL